MISYPHFRCSSFIVETWKTLLYAPLLIFFPKIFMMKNSQTKLLLQKKLSGFEKIRIDRSWIKKMMLIVLLMIFKKMRQKCQIPTISHNRIKWMVSMLKSDYDNMLKNPGRASKLSNYKRTLSPVWYSFLQVPRFFYLWILLW